MQGHRVSSVASIQFLETRNYSANGEVPRIPDTTYKSRSSSFPRPNRDEESIEMTAGSFDTTPPMAGSLSYLPHNARSSSFPSRFDTIPQDSESLSERRSTENTGHDIQVKVIEFSSSQSGRGKYRDDRK